MDTSLPSCLWEMVKDHCQNQDLIIDIKLIDGSIRRNYFINNKGIIQGKIVGGHDGIDTTIDFKPEEIQAIRETGALSSLGLKKWKAC